MELCVITCVFSSGLHDKFRLPEAETGELRALWQYKSQHLFNSQYHH